MPEKKGYGKPPQSRLQQNFCTVCGSPIRGSLCGWECPEDDTAHKGTERAAYYVLEDPAKGFNKPWMVPNA